MKQKLSMLQRTTGGDGMKRSYTSLIIMSLLSISLSACFATPNEKWDVQYYPKAPQNMSASTDYENLVGMYR